MLKQHQRVDICSNNENLPDPTGTVSWWILTVFSLINLNCFQVRRIIFSSLYNCLISLRYYPDYFKRKWIIYLLHLWKISINTFATRILYNFHDGKWCPLSINSTFMRKVKSKRNDMAQITSMLHEFISGQM